jgi:RimJ/RimL family protein N-acetyltransferase
MEKEDLPLLSEWFNKPEIFGEYNPLVQVSKAEMEKDFERRDFEMTDFIAEKKDGSKIGLVSHFTPMHPAGKQLEVGFFLVPSERGKGYGTEALKIIVDYLFLSRSTMRIQVQTDPRNLASQRILEKAGFVKEGTLRKNFFMRGELRDCLLYSILREEWKEPKILTKA